MQRMDKFDSDYEVGLDLERCHLSFSDPAARIPLQNVCREMQKGQAMRRSPYASSQESPPVQSVQRQPAKRQARCAPDGLEKSRRVDQAGSEFGVSEASEGKNPLDLYCSEIRRLNRLNPGNEHRFQVLMSKVSDALLVTISRFPGSVRIVLDGCRNLPAPNRAERSESGFDNGETPTERRIDRSSRAETDDDVESDDRLVPGDFAQDAPDARLIQALAAGLDELHQTARRHGVFHEITRKQRLGLSEAFCRLPLTPLCIENLVARLDDSLKNARQQARSNRVGDEKSAVRRFEAKFEQTHAIGFDEFETIAEEAARLYREWQKIRNRIAEFHVGLVVYLARQYSSEPQELIDLIQEGNIGLIKAVERFNYRLGFRFSTYATYWIRLAMSRHLARSSRAVRLPYRQSLQFGMVRKQREHFRQIHGRSPSTLELARVTGISEAGLRRLEIITQAIASLDAQVEAGENLDLMSMLEQRAFNPPFEEVEKQNMNGLLEKAIGGLDQREAFVIRQRFGIGVYTEKTLQELGAALGLTRERVRQIENGALKKIRRRLEPLAV
jgi:RNA polymerase sigma factor (sigma-70 family)